MVGWGNPVRRDDYPADAFWYGNRPRILYSLNGPQAQALIPHIEASIAPTPIKPGRLCCLAGAKLQAVLSGLGGAAHGGLNAELSSVAVGKDYLGPGLAFEPAPSKTGWSASAFGIIGVTLAAEEGFELSLLGSTIGIDFNDAAIKLPALGKLSVLGWS